MTSLHHVTCIVSDPQKNLDFYTKVLGLRLIKITVNFDDPGTYHFYFANYRGDPGTVFTTFPWPGSKRGKRGIGEAVATYFSIPKGSLKHWENNLRENMVIPTQDESFGEASLIFFDHDGLELRLIETNKETESKEIIGFHGVRLLLEESKQTITLLEDLFGYQVIDSLGSTVRMKGSGDLGEFIDLTKDANYASGSMGAGTIHHIALRTKNQETQSEMRERLMSFGMRPTKIINRNYFTSIYFREPGGVLFEVATDEPGFAIDEPLEHLGEKLCVPEQHLNKIEQIKKTLPLISLQNGIRIP